MDSSAQTPITEEAKPVQSLQPTPPSRKKLILLGLLVVIILLAGTTGVFVMSTKGSAKKPVVYHVTPSPHISPTKEATTWKEHTLKTVGLSFQLPPGIEKLGEWKEEKLPGDTGSVLCFQLPEKSTGFIPKAYAGGIGVCNSNNPASFVIGGSSTNFSVGREGFLTDLQGFTKKDGKYYANFVNNQELEIPLSVEEVANPHKVNIILFKGEKRPPDLSIWPGENALVAILNTNDKTYPGLTVIANVQKVDEQTFKQILESFTFTKEQ